MPRTVQNSSARIRKKACTEYFKYQRFSTTVSCWILLSSLHNTYYFLSINKSQKVLGLYGTNRCKNGLVYPLRLSTWLSSCTTCITYLLARTTCCALALTCLTGAEAAPAPPANIPDEQRALSLQQKAIESFVRRNSYGDICESIY